MPFIKPKSEESVLSVNEEMPKGLKAESPCAERPEFDVNVSHSFFFDHLPGTRAGLAVLRGVNKVFSSRSILFLFFSLSTSKQGAR